VESSAWLLMVSVIATLDIGKAIDDQGREIEPEVVFDNAIFRCVLVRVLSGADVDTKNLARLTRSSALFARDLSTR
jgi:hypothetical protein